MWVILLPIVIAFVLTPVHETGHYLAGRLGGIPAGDMRIVLLAFPQRVATAPLPSRGPRSPVVSASP
jgi:hypothetical protein